MKARSFLRRRPLLRGSSLECCSARLTSSRPVRPLPRRHGRRALANRRARSGGGPAPRMRAILSRKMSGSAPILDDLLARLAALPANVKGEIIDGELHTQPRPRARHSRFAAATHLPSRPRPPARPCRRSHQNPPVRKSAPLRAERREPEIPASTKVAVRNDRPGDPFSPVVATRAHRFVFPHGSSQSRTDEGVRRPLFATPHRRRSICATISHP
jgi:hypothetical protein